MPSTIIEMMKGSNQTDNILIHFSQTGHGSSYDTRDYFTSSSASKAGSIEAICPVDDRGDSIPDISERELN